MSLKYTVSLVNETTNEVVKSAPASCLQNARGWAKVAKSEAGKGHTIRIEKN
jgi:hypothetical protein